MTPNKSSSIAPLEELAFARADYPWDAKAAAERLKESLGWAALASYSLAIDTSEDSESFDAYKFLVVDLVEDQPEIIPAALRDARESLDDLEGNTRDTAESNIAYLEAKYARLSRSSQERVEQPEGAEKESLPLSQEAEKKVDSGGMTPQAQLLAEAESIVTRLETKGCVLPAWGRSALVGFVAGLSKEPSLSPDGFVELSPREYFVRIMESLPSLVPDGEFASGQARRDNSLESLGRRIARSLGNAR